MKYWVQIPAVTSRDGCEKYSRLTNAKVGLVFVFGRILNPRLLPVLV